MSQIIQTQTSPIDDSISRVSALHKSLNTFQSQIKTEYPDINIETDVRRLYFWTVQESLFAYLQHLFLCKKAPLDSGLIDEIIQSMGIRLDPAKKEGYYSSSISGYNNWIKSHLFISFFIDWENCIRLVLNAIDNQPQGDNILKLTNNLLQKCGLGSSAYCELVKVMAYTRNTMHNGSFHNKATVSINYKEYTYNFIQNQAINFATEENIIFWITEMSNMMYEIFNSPALKSAPEIVHNYTSVQFVASTDSAESEN